ncbi:MAG: type II toxin-antitoxin system prevent-host-death family antitoxin [Candidatus Gracilibacteria bacterium]|jgi:prevent-host-death family protein
MYIEQLQQQIEMQPKNTLSITEARKLIFTIASDVQKPDTHYTLTENGKPKAVIISAEEFDSWQETMEILADENIINDLNISKKEIAKGEYVTLDKFLEEEGYIKTNNVRNNPKQKIGKKS